jgi:hypothetical protein
MLGCSIPLSLDAPAFFAVEQREKSDGLTAVVMNRMLQSPSLSLQAATFGLTVAWLDSPCHKFG